MRALVLFLLVSIFINSISYAYSDFYQENKRGWFWFEEKEKLEEEKQRLSGFHPEPGETSTEALQRFQTELEEKKAMMIMSPSIGNTKEFIRYQNEMYRKAGMVSKNMREVMLINPELNIARDIPISDEGIKIRKRAENNEKDQLLKSYAKSFKLLFFYRSDCIFCKNLAPVVETFAHRYGYKVASVTLDGKSLELFPAKYDRALIERFGVSRVPALYIYSEELKIAAPVVSGYAAIDEVENNMFYVLQQISKKAQGQGLGL